MKAADGKRFMRERLELVKAKGKGWQDNKFVNPVTKKIEPKTMYFEKYEDVIVNCGCCDVSTCNLLPAVSFSQHFDTHSAHDLAGIRTVARRFRFSAQITGLKHVAL